MKRSYKYVLDSVTNEVHYLNAETGVFLCGHKPQNMDVDLNWADAHKLIHCPSCIKNLPGKILNLGGTVIKVYDSYEEAEADFRDAND